MILHSAATTPCVRIITNMRPKYRAPFNWVPCSHVKFFTIEKYTDEGFDQELHPVEILRSELEQNWVEKEGGQKQSRKVVHWKFRLKSESAFWSKNIYDWTGQQKKLVNLKVERNLIGLFQLKTSINYLTLILRLRVANVSQVQKSSKLPEKAVTSLLVNK